MSSTQAWLLPMGEEGNPSPGRLELGELTLGTLKPDEVLVAPLLVGWEGNCFHAVQRKPIDVCRARNEPRVVIGNSGVVRVLKTGADVRDLREGEICLVQANYRLDRFGYGMHGAAFGYDARGTIGLLAKRTHIRASCLVPLPRETKHSLMQWAAFSIRYVTAFANWNVALGTWRLQVTEDDQAAPHVWGWGGGTTFAELTLAAQQGAKAAIMTSRSERIRLAETSGLDAIDRRRFPDIGYDESRVGEPQYMERHRASMKAFLRLVNEKTDRLGVSIFVDYLGGTLFPATLRALARQGVVTTAGWREGMKITLIRAVECIDRHQYVHTHYARRSEVVAAMDYGERTGWMPPIQPNERPWSYETVPQLVDTYAQGDIDTYFPLIQVNACDDPNQARRRAEIVSRSPVQNQPEPSLAGT
jgi:NADPH:quinone reductase-like Zn-dependent oxidoreductase